MKFQINPRDFSATNLHLGADTRLIGRGAEAVILEDGDSVVKLFFNAGTRDNPALPDKGRLRAVTREASALHLMHQHNTTGLQLPQPLGTTAFRPPVRSGDRYYLAALRMSRLDGKRARPANLSPRQAAQFMFDAGYTLGTLHNIAAPIPKASLVPFENVKEQVLARSHDPSSVISEQEYAALRRLHRQRDANRPPELMLHADAGPHNLLVQDGRISGVVDWANARRGPREDDLLHYTLPSSLPPTFASPGTMQQVLNGYQSATGQALDPDSIRLSNLTHLAFRLQYFEAIGELNRPDVQQYNLKPFRELIAPHLPHRHAAPRRTAQSNGPSGPGGPGKLN